MGLVTLGFGIGRLLQRHQVHTLICQRLELGIILEPLPEVGVVPEAPACSVEAATAATVEPMALTQTAMVQAAEVEVEQRMVVMAQMVIYELHIGVQTNGNRRSI
jgi:hypothetical protein